MCLRIGAKNWTARPHKGILIRSCGASLEWGKADKNGVKKEREWPGNNWRKKSLSEENPLTLGREVRDLRKERWISGFQVPCFICDQAQLVTQPCPALCDPMDYQTPGLPVCRQRPELIQTPVHQSVMPSNRLILCRPLSSCLQSFPASGSFPMSQFFASDGQSHMWYKHLR